MNDDMMDRNIQSISPINSPIAEEIFKVKPVSRDADRKSDEQFEQQLKKKKKDSEKARSEKVSDETVQSGSYYNQSAAVHDEVFLTEFARKPLNKEDERALENVKEDSSEKAVNDDVDEENKRAENSENGEDGEGGERINVIA